MTCLAEIDDGLDDMTCSLNDTYERALDRLNSLPKQRRQIAFNVFAWLAYALRPLKFGELQTALSIRTGTKNINTHYFRSRKLMLEVCLGLVLIDTESDEIRLLHFTLREFLLKRPELGSSPESFIANTSLTVLCMNDTERLDRVTRLVDRKSPLFICFSTLVLPCTKWRRGRRSSSS